MIQWFGHCSNLVVYIKWRVQWVKNLVLLCLLDCGEVCLVDGGGRVGLALDIKLGSFLRGDSDSSSS